MKTPILLGLVAALTILGLIFLFRYATSSEPTTSSSLSHDAAQGVRDGFETTRDTLRDGYDTTRETLKDGVEATKDAARELEKASKDAVK